MGPLTVTGVELSTNDRAASGYCRRNEGCAFLGADRPELIARLAIGLDRMALVEESQQGFTIVTALRPQLRALRARRHERNFPSSRGVVGFIP